MRERESLDEPVELSALAGVHRLQLHSQRAGRLEHPIDGERAVRNDDQEPRGWTLAHGLQADLVHAIHGLESVLEAKGFGIAPKRCREEANADCL